MQIIQCDDNTCRYNPDGFCKCPLPVIQIGQDYSQKTVNICASYEDKRDGVSD